MFKMYFVVVWSRDFLNIIHFSKLKNILKTKRLIIIAMFLIKEWNFIYGMVLTNTATVSTY